MQREIWSSLRRNWQTRAQSLARLAGAPWLKWTRSLPPAIPWISTWQRLQRTRVPGGTAAMAGESGWQNLGLLAAPEPVAVWFVGGPTTGCCSTLDSLSNLC